ncbi:cell wall protein DAN4-like [Pieris brassicae]|uniref:cell wall protein DAN4-like n=1 Tax=Pieris brassicae TaxID=7116 RepID=UPI001E660E94|nr:cell wall protein DAN4-like [Pieris brassicae]XP_045516830.1 cell wall protein DAN4-like [Pieris brassicae]
MIFIFSVVKPYEMTLTLNSYLYIIALSVFTQHTLQHFIPPPSPCLLAQFCNHTGIPLCGKQKEEKRKFIDDCDMFEFNCDYHKEFKKVADEFCEIIPETSSTSSTYDTTTMTSQSLTPINSSLITERISSTISSSTESTTPTTIPSTTESMSRTTESPTPATIPSTTESMSSSIESTTPTTIPSTTESMSSSTENPTTTTIPSATESMASSTDSITPTTIHIATESTTSSRSESTTVQNNTEVISATVITESNQGDMQVTANYTCTSGLTTLATENSSVVTSTIPVLTQTETSSAQAKTNSTIMTTRSTFSVTCNMYPKDCERPVTWETTSKGETRDFYQILRAKYGNRVKLLRATTHWPTGVVYRFNEENFRFGRHNES